MRAAIVSNDERVLLICFPHPDDGKHLWVMPGGGVEPGESQVAALRRELREEIDFDLPSVPPFIWHRTYTYGPAHRRIRQTDSIYWVRATSFDARLDANPDDNERDAVIGARWWSPDELETTEERIVPRRLGEFVRRAIIDGLPDPPIDVGV